MPASIRSTIEILLTALALLLGNAAPASDAERRFGIGDDPEIPVEAFGDSSRLLIWLPNEAGPRPGRRSLLQALARRSVEVWNADLHAAWFAPPGRAGMRQFDPARVAELIEAARAQGKRHVVLAGSDRGALLALRVARAWQSRQPDARPLDGIVLLDPLPYDTAPAPGEQARFAPVLRATNLPLYLIQPERSTRLPHRLRIADALLSGGAPLFTRLLRNTHSGFQDETDSDLEADDLAAKQALPALLDQAMRRLARAPRPAGPPAHRVAPTTTVTSPREPGLQRWRGERQRIPLRLTGLDGRVHDLDDYRGRVVLVNFWASWCPPCVEELPSLIRLKQRLAEHDFEILGIDIGEQATQVARFLERFEINYPILLDPGMRSVDPWRLYAYPSSFLIDREGRIRYAYPGGLAWDSDAIVTLIHALLNRPAATH